MAVIKSVDILNNSNNQQKNQATDPVRLNRQKRPTLTSDALAQLNSKENKVGNPYQEQTPAATVSISKMGYNLMKKAIADSGREFKIAKLVMPKVVPEITNRFTNIYRRMVDIFA